ncbi:MAG TPA: hypothetical protein VII35_06670, partial [Steroidobacteraceae bacterium]
VLRHIYRADVPRRDLRTRQAAPTNTDLLGLYTKISQMQRALAVNSRCMRMDISWDYVKANARPLSLRLHGRSASSGSTLADAAKMLKDRDTVEERRQ